MEPAPDHSRDLRAGRFRVVDAVFVWVAGVVAGVVAASVALGVTGDDAEDPGWAVVAAAAAAQFATFAAGAWIVAQRRGTGSLRRDYGFVVHARDWWAVPAGVGLLLALLVALSPLLVFVEDQQQVVEDLERATGPEFAVLAVTAVLAAPVLEELLFRGLLLRALCRRYSTRAAIAVSAGAFGAVHLLDPSLGTLVRVPALVVFGAVSAHQAVRTGDLSRSIGLHVGFNLPAVVFA